MAVILALEKLYDDVTALLAARDATIDSRFGWNEPEKQSVAARRVIWVPGDESGRFGECGLPTYSGQLPARALAQIAELFHVWIVGNDPTTPAGPARDRAQYHAARLLYDRWLAAVYESAHGTYQLIDARWAIDRKEFRHGAAIIVVGTVQAPVFEDPETEGVDAAPLDAHIHATLGTTTEEFDVIQPD